MIIGIDLGTLSCTAAYVNAENIPTLISDAKSPGQVRTPNSVAASKDRCYVGRIADEHFLDGMTQSYFCGPKWELGTGNSLFRDIHGRDWTAEVLQALVFNKIRHDCLANGLGLVEEAVIAVPANFTELQRQSVRNIGRLIEMPIRTIVDAPSAAVRGLIVPTDEPQNILVCDFGYGSFEVSVVRYSQNETSVMATCGYRSLGTKTIQEQLAKELQSQIADPALLQSRVVQYQLSSLAEQSIVAMCQSVFLFSSKGFVGGIPIDGSISKIQLELWGKPLVDQCVQGTRKWLDSLGLNLDSFDRILLIGGGILIPGIRSRFCESMGISEGRYIVKHPMAAVAYGTAVLSSDQKALSQFSSGQVTQNPFDLGIRIQDPRTQETAIYKLVKRDAALPAKGSKVFKTSRIDQDRMVIEVVQVKNSARSAISLGNFSFGPLHPTTNHHPIEIEIECQQNGVVRVSARDLLSSQQIQHHVTSLQTERSAAKDSTVASPSPAVQALVDWCVAGGQF
jgi:molecular chaperone DnaK (HSP70)